MSIIVDRFSRRMAENLELRAQYPSTDIWPNPLVDFTLANDYTGEYLFDFLETIFRSPHPIDIIANAFYRPAKIVYLMYLFTLTPETQVAAKKRNWLAEKMLDCISFLRSGDPFIDNGSNIINGYQENIQKYSLSHIDHDSKYIIRRILVALAVLDEYVYYAWLGAGRETHGLYSKNNERVLVREYYDLKVPFWTFSSSLIGSQYAVITNFPSNCTPIYDFNGRVYYDGNYDYNKISIVIDGVECKTDYDSLNRIYLNLADSIKKAKEEVKGLTRNQLLLKFGLAQNHILKKCAAKLDISCQYELPNDIQNALLVAEGESTHSHMLKALAKAKDKESRIHVLQKSLIPGNMDKWD